MTAASPDTAAAQWRALGAQVRLVVTRPQSLERAVTMAETELAAIDETCSRFRDDSELRSLDHANGVAHRVSPLLAEAVAVALRAARLTDGDVDPTVGAAMAAAGYDRDFELIHEHGPVVRTLTRADWREIQLDTGTGLLRLPIGTRLDLGATAKSWTADRIASAVAMTLGGGVLVSLGGDVAVAGVAPSGGWTIRVQDITSDIHDAAPEQSTSVALAAGGLATSGTSARRWTRDGQHMHHIIDPRTSKPARTPWRTVSVAAASCVDANTAATAAIARGKTAIPWLRRLGVAARFVDRDGNVCTVGNWPTDPS